MLEVFLVSARGNCNILESREGICSREAYTREEHLFSSPFATAVYKKHD